MIKGGLVVFALVIGLGSQAQLDSLAMIYGSTITSEDLRLHLTTLSSDEYEGRETGFSGQKKAAAYIVKHFQSIGIPPIVGEKSGLLINGYEQSFDLKLKKPGGLSVSIDGKRYEFLDDILYFNKEINADRQYSEILFTGYGLDSPVHDDLEGVDCQGCAMLALNGLPENKKGAPKVKIEEGTSEMQLMGVKGRSAAKMGAEVLFLVSDKIGKMRGQFGSFLQSSRMSLIKEEESKEEAGVQTILITEEMANELLNRAGTSLSRERKRLNKKGPRTRSINVSASLVLSAEDSTLKSENVLGYIEGGDKKEELVIVTAHYDHVGVMDGKVFNGADDDGSGTVALLELAEAFAKAKLNGHGPRRSVLFMTVSGEEKGLLGSEFYSDNPIFPLEGTVADLNIDMIGRHDKEHEDKKPYVYIIGSDRLSSELHKINETVNERFVGLELDYTFNAADDPNRFYYRSDHYNFARKGIPVVFYFSGVHDDYHQPGDDVEKIEFDLLEKRSRLVFHTTWELANREERIVVDRKEE